MDVCVCELKGFQRRISIIKNVKCNFYRMIKNDFEIRMRCWFLIQIIIFSVMFIRNNYRRKGCNLDVVKLKLKLVFIVYVVIV